MNAFKQYLLPHVRSVQLPRQYGADPEMVVFDIVIPLGRLQHVPVGIISFTEYVHQVAA